MGQTSSTGNPEGQKLHKGGKRETVGWNGGVNRAVPSPSTLWLGFIGNGVISNPIAREGGNSSAKGGLREFQSKDVAGASEPGAIGNLGYVEALYEFFHLHVSIVTVESLITKTLSLLISRLAGRIKNPFLCGE